MILYLTSRVFVFLAGIVLAIVIPIIKLVKVLAVTFLILGIGTAFYALLVWISKVIHHLVS
jgi:hypothetical protein